MLIDVVIPCFNQFEQLKITIEAYIQQKTNCKFRLIIIDDGSTEIPAYDIDQVCHPLHYYYIRQDNAGRSVARNTGIKNLKGEYVIFNDSDRPPAPDFIEKHLSTLLMKNNVISVGSPREIYMSTINPSRIHEIIQGKSSRSRLYPYAKKIDYLYDENGNTKSSLAWLSTYTGNIAMPTTIAQNELFDEVFSSWGLENLEWGYRLYHQGFIFHRSYDAVNYHIAHNREMDFYLNNFKISHQHFCEKYSSRDISLLYNFMLGEISLQEYEEKTSGETCIPCDKPQVYFKMGGII